MGDLFVDVNILEQVSSSRRSELDDLWQDFTKGNSNYHSLDRIGLGKERQRVYGLDVLERNTNLMVVGKPGSGKTTDLQRIVTECNDGKLQAQRIPMLIKLRNFVDDGRKYAYNLEQFLGQLWRLSNADIELVLSQGRALVLLDGLDEVTGEAGKEITKEIKRFARAYPQVQVVVTCRTQSQESRFERFDYVEVADFNEQQVRAFAEHWFGTVCGDTGENKARDFLEQLFREENKPIRELAITPILLSLTCLVFRGKGQFYSKRSKLYEEGLELLLVQWDKSREVERDEVYRDLSVERKLELLSYVAVKKFEQEQYVLFEQEELEGYIGEFLGIERRESQGVMRAIAYQHGLLIERSRKVWSFSHLTFQEYLVAKYIIVNNACLAASQYLVARVHNIHWQEIFLIAIEMINDIDDLIKYLKQKIDNLLATYEKLQIYLKWLVIKSQEVKVSYNLVAIRYFYFILSMNIAPLGKNEFLLLNAATIFSLHYNLGIEQEMIRSLASHLDPDVALDQGLPSCLDPTIELNLDRSLMRLLHRLLEAQEELTKNSSREHDAPISRNQEVPNQWLDFSNIFENSIETEYENIGEINFFSIAQKELELALERAKIADENLYTAIIKNKERLFPKFDDFKSMKQWWLENGNQCIEDFKNILIKYRKIGYNWEFNNIEIDALRQYCDLSKFLIVCLQSSGQVSKSVREEIVNTLWLPIC